MNGLAHHGKNVPVTAKRLGSGMRGLPYYTHTAILFHWCREMQAMRGFFFFWWWCYQSLWAIETEPLFPSEGNASLTLLMT